jgi:hypothetical protein
MLRGYCPRQSIGAGADQRRSVKDMGKTKTFSDLSAEVRKRHGASEEIEARKLAIIAAVRSVELHERRRVPWDLSCRPLH